MMLCDYCTREISEGDIYRAYDDALCETCFYDNYTYCNQCDIIVEREYIEYDNNEDPLCRSCYNDNYCDDAPENPDVTEADRGLIIKLSRDWVNGDICHKSTIKINKKDYGLIGIKDMVGLVDQPLYLFGLKDMDEYSIAASPDIIDDVKGYMQDYNVFETSGTMRIGISYSLRTNHQNTVVDLIKSLTRTQLAVSA